MQVSLKLEVVFDQLANQLIVLRECRVFRRPGFRLVDLRDRLYTLRFCVRDVLGPRTTGASRRSLIFSTRSAGRAGTLTLFSTFAVDRLGDTRDPMGAA